MYLLEWPFGPLSTMTEELRGAVAHSACARPVQISLVFLDALTWAQRGCTGPVMWTWGVVSNFFPNNLT